MKMPTKQDVWYWLPAMAIGLFALFVFFDGPIWERVIYAVILGPLLQAFFMLLYGLAVITVAHFRGVEVPSPKDEDFISGMLGAAALVAGLWIWNVMNTRSDQRWLADCLSTSETIAELNRHYPMYSQAREDAVASAIDWCFEQLDDG